MRKYLKTLALIVAMVFIAVLAGCGSSDKFSGTWVGINSDSLRIMNIQKNGDNYLVKTSEYYYAFTRDVTKMDGWKPTYSINETLKVKKEDERSATVKNNNLVFDGTMDTEFITYKEDNKKLSYKKAEFSKTDEKSIKKIVTDNLKQLKENAEKEGKADAAGFGNLTGFKYDDSLLDTLK